MERVRAHERELTAYALERLAEVPGLTIYGPRDADAPRRARLVRARRRAPARRRRDPRPRGRLRPRRPPLRPAADARARRRRDDARLVRRPQHARGRRPRWSTGSAACARSAARRARSGGLMDEASTARRSSSTTSARTTGASWTTPDLEFEDNNPLCGDELRVQLERRRRRHGRGPALLRPRLRDQPGRGVDGLRRGQGHEGRRPAAARPRRRPRPARHRDLGDAHEVRAAVAEGAQERGARRRRRLGAATPEARRAAAT